MTLARFLRESTGLVGVHQTLGFVTEVKGADDHLSLLCWRAGKLSSVGYFVVVVNLG